MAVAGIAALAASTAAQAGIITVEMGQDVGGLDVSYAFDLDGDGADDISVNDGKGWSYLIQSLQPNGKGGTTQILSNELNVGDSVPSSGSLNQTTGLLIANGCCTPGTNFIGGALGSTGDGIVDTAFFGIRFESSLSTEAPVLEGWLEFSAEGATTDNLDLRFVRYAYEDTGAAITIGQTAAVPGPAASLLLVTGLAGLGLSRRRRRKHS